MENNSSSEVYVAALTILIQFMFLPISHGRIIIPMDANLIEQTCRNTPYHDLCVSSLLADPQSSNANVTGLVLIMVNVVKSKATESINKINDLLRKRPGNEPLSSCKDQYHAVLDADMSSANEALTKGDPKFSEEGLNDAVVEAQSCEDGFSGSSPMTDLNKVAHDVATFAAVIVRNLL